MSAIRIRQWVTHQNLTWRNYNRPANLNAVLSSNYTGITKI